MAISHERSRSSIEDNQTAVSKAMTHELGKNAFIRRWCIDSMALRLLRYVTVKVLHARVMVKKLAGHLSGSPLYFCPSAMSLEHSRSNNRVC